jgi:hypothetical protein
VFAKKKKKILVLLISRRVGIKRTAIVGVVVILTFAVCWLPFILAGQETTLMVSDEVVDSSDSYFFALVCPVVVLVVVVVVVVVVTDCYRLLQCGLTCRSSIAYFPFSVDFTKIR